MKAETNDNQNDHFEKSKKAQKLKTAEYETNKLTHVNIWVPYPHGGRSYENEPNDRRSHRGSDNVAQVSTKVKRPNTGSSAVEQPQPHPRPCLQKMREFDK
jgi:hypothetical protein